MPSDNNTDEKNWARTPDAKMHGPYPHGRRWRVQVRVKGRRKHESFASYADAVDFMNAGGDDIRSVSDALLVRAADAASSRDGWVYAVALSQENPRRMKVGFTKDVAQRFRDFRTTNPTAVLLAAWEAAKSEEMAAHKVLTGRIGLSEVFVVRDIEASFSKLDALLGERMRPLSGQDGKPPVLVPRKFATVRQRPPKPNGKPAIADLVIADVRARQGLGQKRYGTDLQANNGRDALVDAYQEAIDLAMYLRQLLEERNSKP